MGLLDGVIARRNAELAKRTQQPFQMSWGEKAKEVGKALFGRMPQHLAAGVGMAIHGVADYEIKDAPLAPLPVKEP